MSKLFDQVRRRTVEALDAFDMIGDGDRVMVCVSGGKDSTLLLMILDDIRRRAPFDFELGGVLLDQKQPGFDADAYCAWLAERDLPLTIIEQDTYSIVTEKIPEGRTYCSLCSRLRRGILYNHAHDHGFTRMALGHHRDDLNETLLLNLFFSGNLASMPPKLLSQDKRNVVIRPFAYVAEADLSALAKDLQIPVIPCNLCGSQDNMRRQQMKQLLLQLEESIPNIGATMLTAQGNIYPSQLLDQDAWDFAALEADNPS
jgi:tRNA 2-thiocytidine biosynthesis protein TtcA